MLIGSLIIRFLLKIGKNRLSRFSKLIAAWSHDKITRFKYNIWNPIYFWPQGFADAVIGTAYFVVVVVLDVLVLGKHFWIPRKKCTAGFFPEKSGNHFRLSAKRVELNACPRNSWKSLQHVHEKSGIQCLSTKIMEFQFVY